MSQKRRDKKNRVLHNGESQQKDGRYRFTYYVNNQQKCIYSWKLVETDLLPKGKRECVSLRTQEEAIREEIENGSFFKEKYTLEEYIEKSITISEVRLASNTIYIKRSQLKNVKKYGISKKEISTITMSDVKYFIVCLYKNGLKYGTIKQYKSMLYSTFREAMEEDLINKNPADFNLSKVIPNNTVKKTALTEKQIAQYLNYIQNSNFSNYYDEINLLFNTGLRISEFCGLTFKDIDLENRLLKVDHQLVYNQLSSSCSISKPKTKNGNRTIPLNDEAYRSVYNIMHRKRPTIEPIIDGHGKFLSLNQYGEVCNSQVWERRFKIIWDNFKKTAPTNFPKVTAHICRHTYCSVLASKNINPKVLQYLMGHSSVDITLDVYTHTQLDNVITELERVDCI
jgi:integrase